MLEILIPLVFITAVLSAVGLMVIKFMDLAPRQELAPTAEADIKAPDNAINVSEKEVTAS